MTNSRIAEVFRIINIKDISYGGFGPAPVLAKTAMPYIVVREIFSRELTSLNGRSGLTRTVMQIEVWDRDYEQAYQKREEIKDGILGFSGPVDTQAVDGPISHNADVELYDGVRELHSLITRLEIWWYVISSSSTIPYGRELPVPSDYRDLPV